MNADGEFRLVSAFLLFGVPSFHHSRERKTDEFFLCRCMDESESALSLWFVFRFLRFSFFRWFCPTLKIYNFLKLILFSGSLLVKRFRLSLMSKSTITRSFPSCPPFFPILFVLLEPKKNDFLKKRINFKKFEKNWFESILFTSLIPTAKEEKQSIYTGCFGRGGKKNLGGRQNYVHSCKSGCIPIHQLGIAKKN